MVKAGDPALGQHRLIGVEKGYFHHEGMGAASGKLIEAQAGIDIAREDWGSGLVASADGLRFVVPVRSLYGRLNPHYFGQSRRSKGATWLAVVSDRVMGLGGLLVPGTMPDALVGRAADMIEVGPHRQDPVLPGRRASAQRAGDRRVAPVGSEQQPGAKQPRARRALAPDGHRAGRLLHRGHLPAVKDCRSCLPCCVQDPGVELQPGDDPAVGREPVNLRKRPCGELVSVDVQSALADLAGRAEGLCPGHAEVGEFSQRHRTDEVTAHLVSRKGGPVDQDGREASRCKPRGSRCPGRAAADDYGVRIVPHLLLLPVGEGRGRARLELPSLIFRSHPSDG